MTFDIAIEFLNILNHENLGFFNRTFPVAQKSQLHGLENSGPTDTTWLETACTLAGFLQATGLTYYEFLELWKSGFLEFTEFLGGDRGTYIAGSFPLN